MLRQIRSERRQKAADGAGFILVSVLLVIAVAAVLATAVAVWARADRADAALELRVVQGSAIADAGIARVIAALETPGDEFAAPLLDGSGRVTWRFGGRDVVLSLARETGKVDLNSGDPDLVVNLIRAVVRDETTSRRLIARLAALRGSRQYLESVRGILDEKERTGRLAQDLEGVFTVYTNLRGFDPKVAPIETLRSLPGLHVSEMPNLRDARLDGKIDHLMARYGPLLKASRPIYRVGAHTRGEGNVNVWREALIVHNSTTHRVWVVFWRDGDQN